MVICLEVDYRGLLYSCLYIPWLPWWPSGKESICQHSRCEFDSWVRKIPWRRKWQPTPVFLPGKSYRQRSLEDTVHGVPRVRHNIASKQQQIAFVLYKKAICIFTYSLMSSKKFRMVTILCFFLLKTLNGPL